MSVTHLRFGAAAAKSRSSVFSAGRFAGSLCVVIGLKRLQTQLFRPNSRIAAATVLRQADCKSSRCCNTSATFWLP